MVYTDLIEWFEKAKEWFCMLEGNKECVSYRNYQEDTYDMEILIFKNAPKLIFVDYTHRFVYPYAFEQVDDKLGVLSLDNDVLLFGNGDYEYNQI